VASPNGCKALGIPVFDSNEVEELSVYIDGADEIDGQGYMVKGGGAALTREKIVAAQSRRFVCIADESKLVPVLGRFPLPVEVIPMATQRITRQFAALGGQATVRLKDGQPLVTDNGQHILDVTGLQHRDPLAFESEVNQWPGVVTVGVFAHQKAAVCLLGTAQGVKTLTTDGPALRSGCRPGCWAVGLGRRGAAGAAAALQPPGVVRHAAAQGSAPPPVARRADCGSPAGSCEVLG
jgi:ribose 5-phosphate isomerase A